MPEANNQNKAAAGRKSQSAASRWPDISGIPTTPVAPPAARPPLPRMRRTRSREFLRRLSRPQEAGRLLRCLPIRCLLFPSGFPGFPGISDAQPAAAYLLRPGPFLKRQYQRDQSGRIYRRKGVLLRLHLCHRIHLPKCIRRLPYGYDPPFQRPDLLSADHGLRRR